MYQLPCHKSKTSPRDIYIWNEYKKFCVEPICICVEIAVDKYTFELMKNAKPFFLAHENLVTHRIFDERMKVSI